VMFYLRSYHLGRSKWCPGCSRITPYTDSVDPLAQELFGAGQQWAHPRTGAACELHAVAGAELERRLGPAAARSLLAQVGARASAAPLARHHVPTVSGCGGAARAVSWQCVSSVRGGLRLCCTQHSLYTAALLQMRIVDERLACSPCCPADSALSQAGSVLTWVAV